jgi:hypothetical protein
MIDGLALGEKFTAPLTDITAAVVGVILNLAAFFADHVFWPHGFQGRFGTVFTLIGLVPYCCATRSASSP